jgi:molybdopterin-guanine dinucleotide biosynthesis protein A
VKPGAGILAGGRSLRMGQDKAFLDVGGRPLIDRLIERLGALTDCIVIASRDPARYARHGARSVADELAVPSPLAGVHAILKACGTEWSAACAVDLPCLNVDLLRHLLGQAEGFDAVVPESSTGPEPLCAVYSAACIGPMERSAERGVLGFSEALGECRVRRVAIRESEWLVGGLSPFTNLNRPEDYDTFLSRIRNSPGPFL